MTTAAVEFPAWPRRRWWGVFVLLLVAQVGLIFWLGDRSPAVPREASTNPTVFLAPGLSSELLALNDPTLFAWANRHGFSGAAWLKLPRVNYQLTDWTEPPRWLSLRVADLGNTFRRFVETNLAPPVRVADKLEPRFTPLELPPPATSMATRSSLRVEGKLAARHLLSEIELPSWPHTDLLTSSAVQVLVDADGQTISATLLSSSGSKEADQHALDLAKTARFNSLRGSGTAPLTKTLEPLRWGKLIFEWHTVPMPPSRATGTPPANP
jgi:TonB family protein